ncbi:hypothetical protein M405DRAFT_758574 [Rhizopogon salebrosus TDB-379]|nr:hypothetical protein M405DRAFT_758574 [Rhizopogon salebrosus TDB-379]
MNQNTPRPPNIRGRVQTLIGGITLVGAGFGAWWILLQKRQARKEQQDPIYGGALPTWEYRLYQAQHPANSPSNPLTLRQGTPAEPGAPSTQPRSDEDASAKRADQAVPYAPQTKLGASDPNVRPAPGPEPTPQRATNDGRIYSKVPAYADSYKEQRNK